MSKFPFFKPHISLRYEQLNSVMLFETLTRREFSTIDAMLHERDYVKDELIFDVGEDSQAIYIVLSGAASVARRANGVEEEIIRLGPGDFFGELALLDNAPRSAVARAAEDCRLVVMFRADLAALADTHVALSSKILLQMARHLAHIVRQTAMRTGATLHV
ncbi:cyclic nucleotide-binding domain-containing protein [Undibacterium sp. TJN25]|uniref:cyclic nucleotide-binding domain-containing protein n=1 Tax=Undibacterium sp. TJN25 TaxID=3413056 RepID=UPI003BF07336